MNLQPPPPSRVVWFEIPATDLDRAVRFYANVLDAPIKKEIFTGEPIAVFPHEKPAISGCLVEAKQTQPTGQGVVVYLNCNGILDDVIARTSKAGGSVVEPKSALPPGMGFVAHILDSEGNRIGLHSTS
jgi:uncharacterized protein